MSKPEEFRGYAQRCTEIARLVAPEEAAALTAMAEAWIQLAEDEERIEDLIRDADKAFAAPHAPGGPPVRAAFWDHSRRTH